MTNQQGLSGLDSEAIKIINYMMRLQKHRGLLSEINNSPDDLGLINLNSDPEGQADEAMCNTSCHRKIAGTPGKINTKA